MATATREKPAQTEESRRAEDFVCVITGNGEKDHAEPLVFSAKEHGKDAKRLWAMHRSRAHDIRSPRREKERKQAQRGRVRAQKAKRIVRRRSARQSATITQRVRDWTVEPTVGVVMEFTPTRVSRITIERGEFSLFDTKGQRVVGGRVSAVLGDR